MSTPPQRDRRIGAMRSLLPAVTGALASALLGCGYVTPAAATDEPPLTKAERDRLKHERTLASAIRKLDFGERLLAADHTALKRAAKERSLAALNVCADPGNMPFSNQEQQGFQNKIAEVLAAAMDTKLVYYWRPLLSRGLTRNTFDTKECDVLMDMPSEYDGIVTTEPVYRTTYVLATRADRKLDFTSLDDPRLKTLRIGVYQTSSIRTALKQRGIHQNVVLHTITHDGDLRAESQPWHQIQQVVDGTLDVAGAWGPFAGWMQKKKGAPITITPVNVMEPEVPLEFSLSIGVRKADQILRYKIELALDERKDEIEAILRDFGVPLVECSKCFVAGDLPAHGIYQIPLEAAAGRDESKIAAHQRVTPERLDAWIADGADIDQELANAALAGDLARVEALHRSGANLDKLDKQGQSPLHTAARARKDAVLQKLLELGAKVDTPDSDGLTAVVHAALRDHVPAIKLLAARGADLNVRSIGGATPIAIAIAEDNYAAAVALAEAGADVESRSGEDDLTPLMMAAGREATQFSLGAGRRKVTRFHPQYPSTLDLSRALIARGAKIDARSRSGLTPLMLAAAKDQVAVVGMLVQSGANAKLASKDGKSALDIARQNGNDQVVGILRLLEQTGSN